MKKIVVALDGPAAAGKSTIAKEVAKRMNLTYIDTGAMYRAVTLYCLENNIDCENESLVSENLSKISIELNQNGSVFLNNKDVSFSIRSRLVNANVSYIASYKDVRLFLVEQQRKMAENTSVIMDGRDIGSYVLPNADVKIYQVASCETRAKRRYLENMSKGIEGSLESIKKELEKRDYIDSHREFAPLKKAEDAIEIDTSSMLIEEVVQEVMSIIEKKVGC